MIRYVTFVIITIILCAGCHGCSFIRDQFAKKQSQPTRESTQEEQPKQESEPIPVNPRHS